MVLRNIEYNPMLHCRLRVPLAKVATIIKHPQGERNNPEHEPCSKSASSTTYPYPGRPDIVDFGGLNGPLLLQNPLEKVGGEAPYLFPWVLR